MLGVSILLSKYLRVNAFNAVSMRSEIRTFIFSCDRSVWQCHTSRPVEYRGQLLFCLLLSISCQRRVSAYRW